MEKYIKIKRNEYIVNERYYEICKEFKIPYAAIQEINKWAYIRIDYDTVGPELYEKLDNYIKENSIEVLDNIHHMISSYLNYNCIEDMDKCYCISCFSYAKVRKEVAPIIVESIVDTLMDIIKNKL